ncbi:MAG: nuclear transport factor 2 family protein, partial [Candidatus Binataceae bacterium]
MPGDTTTARDRDEILRLHGVWMRANCGLQVAGLRESFVGGKHFQGFNLNAYTYNQRDEWERLWRYLNTVMEITAVRDEKLMRLEIRGDMAWLAFESTLTAKAREGAGGATSGVALAGEPADMRFRGTEIFVRADDAGRPVWKMWHCHYSP